MFLVLTHKSGQAYTYKCSANTTKAKQPKNKRTLESAHELYMSSLSYQFGFMYIFRRWISKPNVALL